MHISISKLYLGIVTIWYIWLITGTRPENLISQSLNSTLKVARESVYPRLKQRYSLTILSHQVLLYRHRAKLCAVMTDVSCPQNGLTMTTLWKDRFALTLQIIFRGTRQIFHVYHTKVLHWRWEEVRGDWGINTREGGKGRERSGEEKRGLPACLPGWQLTLLDVTFTVCWRFVWKPSHLWLAIWLMSLSGCLYSLRRGHGLIPGITDLFAFGANL